jgi:hypothetical protein
MLPQLLAMAPILAQMAGDIWGKKKNTGATITAEQMMPKWQSQTGQDLSTWIQQYLKNYVPGAGYTGQFTAGATDLEKSGLDQLGDIMKAPATGDLFAAGKQQVLDTLGGKYADASSSPYIKSMINLSKQNLGDLVTQTRAQRGARGTYFTKAGLKEEGLLNERTANALNATIGDWLNTERGRQFSAAPIAQQMDQYGTLTAPLAKVGASQTYGNLMRTIQQSDFESQYQDFVRQRQELSALPNQAQSLYSTRSEYGVPSWKMPDTQENNSLGNIMGILSKLNLAGFGDKGDIWTKLQSVLTGAK